MQPTSPAPISSRFLAVDALRGLAVVLMVQQHLGVWLTSLKGARSFVTGPLLSLNLLGGFAAPLFVVLAGFGLGLLDRQRVRDGELFVRGVVLFGFGLLLDLLVPSWFVPESFYVLHLLGVWLVLGVLVRRAPRTAGGLGFVASLGIAASLGLALFFQHEFRVPPRLANEAMNDPEGALGALGLALFRGHFPLFPWLAFAFAGFWAGRLLVASRFRASYALAVGLGACAGALALTGALAGRSLRGTPFWRATWFTFYPAGTELVLLLAAGAVLLVTLAVHFERAIDVSPTNGFVLLGRTSLTWMFVHIVLFKEGFARLGWDRSLPAGAALGVIVVVLVAFSLLARPWSRVGFRGSLEWALRRLSARTPKSAGPRPV